MIFDNGHQYASKEYKQLAKTWNFQHYTSSPHCPKGNGTAKAAVKQVKRILKMSDDRYLAVLEHRNTPDDLASTNEKLMSRRTRSSVPVKPSLLKPYIIPTKSIVQVSTRKKQQNKKYYDKKSRSLPSLVVAERIRTKTHPQTWTQGTVVRKETDRSYIINANGRNYRRNRFHIRNSKELHPDQQVAESESDLPLVPKRDHDGSAAQFFSSKSKTHSS